MADLQVDDRILADCEHRLSRLHRELRHLDALRDQLRTAWGADAVTGAMGDFFDNWSRYRGKLLDAMESTGTLATRARRTFHEADERLAR